MNNMLYDTNKIFYACNSFPEASHDLYQYSCTVYISIITFILDFPYNTYEKVKVNVGTKSVIGAAVVEWLSSWLAEQEVRRSIPGPAT